MPIILHVPCAMVGTVLNMVTLNLLLCCMCLCFMINPQHMHEYVSVCLLPYQLLYTLFVC